MSAATNATIEHGTGWVAVIYPGHMLITVDTGPGDYIPDAIDTLLPPRQQPHWTVELVDQTAAGRDVYLARLWAPGNFITTW